MTISSTTSPDAQALPADPAAAAPLVHTAALAAARGLTLACRFDEADALLDSLPAPATGLDRARLALARAEVRHRSTYVRRPGDESRDDTLALLDEAATLLEDLDDPEPAWDVDRLRLQHTYAAALRRDDGGAWFGPEGRDPELVDALRHGAATLLRTAPDEGRGGWAEMLLGWIHDNILGDRQAAPAHYEAALRVARSTGDDVMLFEAQRHLGDHAHDDGDHAAARRCWEESAEAAARAGHVSGVLAQQVLLAVLAGDAGDDAGARALAGEVRRWAGAIGAASLVAQAEGFLAGVDPTRPPEVAAD